MKINEIMSSLRSVYQDWGYFLVNPRFARINNLIAWDSFKPRMLTDPIMPVDVIELIDDGQYTFQISEDGAIIQIFYCYDAKRKKMIAANLAFYGTKPAYFYQLENLNHETIKVESAVKWLRIDYDPERARGVLHHYCHIHLSGFPNSRFIVNGLPTPKQFIEFIMAFFYPEIYKKHRKLNDKEHYPNKDEMFAVNFPNISLTKGEIYSDIMHFHVPASQK